MKVIKEGKALNISALKKSKIKTYAKIYNLRKKKIEYLDIRKNTFSLLKKSISPVPWVYYPGENLIDGELIRPLDYTYIRKKHPNEKLIFVINYPLKRSFLRVLKEVFENWLVKRIYHDSSLNSMMKERPKILKLEAEKIEKDSQALLVKISKGGHLLTVSSNKKEIKKVYNEGILRTKEILDFIKK